MLSSRPYPPQAPPARPMSGYTVMSWHWFGPDGGRAPGPPGPPGPPAPAAAAAGAPAGASAGGAPAGASGAAGAPATAGAPGVALAALGRGSTRRGGGARSLKMRGELTMAAVSGAASGTLITSMRNRAVFGSSIGPSKQPASSSSERTPADPEM